MKSISHQLVYTIHTTHAHLGVITSAADITTMTRLMMKKPKKMSRYVCYVCGKEFESLEAFRTRPMCSGECRAEYKRREQRAYCKAHPDIIKKYRESANIIKNDKPKPKKRKSNLTSILRECRAEGITYAERQMRNTFKMLKENQQ